jgi:hypothetical protein
MRQAGLRIVLIASLLTVGLRASAQNADSESSEYLIKAGFIYNFGKLVEWPGSAFPQSSSPLVIGVLGNDNFAATLEHVVDGKKIDARPFVVKRLRWSKDFTCGCHILFIASAESVHADETLQALKNSSVLTIAETPGFARRGGVINFTLEDSKVRFEVNVDAAHQVGLNISSRLLSLAKIVQTQTSLR